MTNVLGFRVWGARGSLPRLSRGQVAHGGNTVCLEVLHPGKEWIVLDAGTGIANLGDHILKQGSSRKIHLFLSHYHWDHVMGLPFFGPIYRKGFTINLYGLLSDEGHINEMLDVVFSPLYSPIYSPDNLLGSLSIPKASEHREVDGVTIRTFELNDVHPGGYMVIRVESASGCFVYASDVELRDPHVKASLMACLRGADLFLCDATFGQERFETAVGWGHSSIEAAFEVAKQVGVKRLMGIHYDPLRTDADLDETCERLNRQGKGPVVTTLIEGDTVWL